MKWIIAVFLATFALVAQAGTFDAPQVPWGKSVIEGKSVTVQRAYEECTIDNTVEEGWTARNKDGSYTVCLHAGRDELMIWGHEKFAHILYETDHTGLTRKGYIVVRGPMTLGEQCPLIIRTTIPNAKPGDGLCITSIGELNIIPGRASDVSNLQ